MQQILNCFKNVQRLNMLSKTYSYFEIIPQSDKMTKGVFVTYPSMCDICCKSCQRHCREVNNLNLWSLKHSRKNKQNYN